MVLTVSPLSLYGYGMKIAATAFPVLFLLTLLSAVPGQAQTWGQPVWADDFNGAANSQIDPTKWTYDTGNLQVNNELEIYCSPTMTTLGCDPVNPNAFIDGAGHLVIQQRLVNGNVWTSARLKTQGVKTFQYGRIESSIEFPSHQGLWPAFWMLGNNIDTIGWPNCGEVDIMENWPALGASKNQTSMHGDAYHGGNSLSSGFNFPNGERVDTAFHTYGVIWSPNMMQFYFDDPSNITFVRTAADVPAGGTWPFNNPFFLITNMAVGGSLGGTSDGGTAGATPSMMVDYVRSYQAATIPGPNITPSTMSVKAGASGTTSLTLNAPIGSGLVYLDCTNAPAKSVCSIETPNAINSHVADFRSNPQDQVTVHVTTTANTANNLRSLRSAWAMMLGAFVLLPAISKRRWSRRMALIAGVLAILIAATAFQSCGGGSGTSTGGGGGGATNGTPTGQYTLKITAYTVSGDTSTANVTLNVN
jgi:beta-glucanase (GH16 family)